MVFYMNLFVLSINEDLALSLATLCAFSQSSQWCYVLLGAKVEMHWSFVESPLKLTNNETCEQTPI